jgi:hypothetical protein
LTATGEENTLEIFESCHRQYRSSEKAASDAPEVILVGSDRRVPSQKLKYFLVQCSSPPVVALQVALAAR